MGEFLSVKSNNNNIVNCDLKYNKYDFESICCLLYRLFFIGKEIVLSL